MSSKFLFSLSGATLVGILLGWVLRGLIVEDGARQGDGEGQDRVVQASSRSDADRRSTPPGGRDLRPRGGVEAGNGSETVQVSPELVAELLATRVASLETRTVLVDPDEPLARFLALSRDEAELLNGMWEELKPRLDSMRMERVRDQRLPDGGMWLGVEPFPEEGDRMRQEFLRTAHEVLGESRGKVFLDTIKAHGAYGQWGKTVGSGYSVRIRVQEDESLLYEIVEQATAEGKPGKTWLTKNIPPHLEEIAVAAGIALEP